MPSVSYSGRCTVPLTNSKAKNCTESDTYPILKCMIGIILGIIAAIGFIGAAFSGDYTWIAGLSGMLLILTLAGVFLFPRTIGLMLTSVQFVSPIAVIGGGITQGWGMFWATLGLALGVTIAVMVIGLFRRDAI